MAQHDLFLSYSRKDQAFARHIRDMLRSEGYDVWMDEQNLFASQDWWQGIQKAIRSSEALLLIMSPDSQNSAYVDKELRTARRAGTSIIPVLYRGFGWRTLGSIHYIDMTAGVAITTPPPKLIQGIEAARKSTQRRRLIKRGGVGLFALLIVGLVGSFFIVSQSNINQGVETVTPAPQPTNMAATQDQPTLIPTGGITPLANATSALILTPTITNVVSEATITYGEWQNNCGQDSRLTEIATTQTEYLSGLSLPALANLQQQDALTKDAQGLSADQQAAIKGYPGRAVMTVYTGETEIHFEYLLSQLPQDFSCKASGFAQLVTQLNGQKRYYAALVIGDASP